MYWKYEIDPASFQTELELELLANIDMLQTVEIGVRSGMWHAIHRYTKTNNRCMKEYDKDK